MTQPKPSAEALAAADAICKQHGMLPGGYMRDSLAEALEAFALEQTTTLREIVAGAHAIACLCRPGGPDARCAELQALAAPRVATMLDVPITEAERDAISKDGP